jgi:cytochrome c553
MKKLLLSVVLLVVTASFAFADGKALYAKCAGCHGVNAQNKALGKSKVIKGWKKSKIVKALKGYKKGTYGGAMKGIMKGQVATYSDKQISQVADYISKLK